LQNSPDKNKNKIANRLADQLYEKLPVAAKQMSADSD